ncbi:MAG: aldehyde dehydrogenase family protein, partial [bacterium]|nr:aldehyde dehydrogenase family protein [bacterium]
AELLRGYGGELAELMVDEIAKPSSEAEDEVERTAELIHFYSEEALRMEGEYLRADVWPGMPMTKKAWVVRVPLGVVAAIVPFNYPVNEAAPKLVAALVTGNTVVYKPSSQGAMTSLHLAHIFQEAGLPAGVLNVITGKGEDIGNTLVCHPLVAAINFTGSTKTAQTICAIAPLKKLVFGLSGKDAAIVLKDADIDLAAEQIVEGAFAYSGQRCTAIKRVLVEQTIITKLQTAMIAKLEKTKLGDPRKENTTHGPVISDESAEFIMSLVDDAVEKGAKIIYGGERKGRYIPLTLLDHVDNRMRIFKEEPFGPVLPLIRVKDVHEAVAVANSSPYGLQGSIFTADLALAMQVAEKLEVGTVNINGKDSRSPDHFPFLGVKASGVGVVQGARYLLHEMTRPKVTVLNLPETE